DRFHSPVLGSLASLLLLFFLVFNLVAQFTAGGLIMRQACRSVEVTAIYREARGLTVQTLHATGAWKEPTEPPQGKDLYGPDYPDYVLGILIFSLTVVAYTTYGGFWAVTWTDVLQGLVIVFGAVALMVLTLMHVGSLEIAT